MACVYGGSSASTVELDRLPSLLGEFELVTGEGTGLIEIVDGIDIEDRETLFDLASNVGVDTDQLEADWDDFHIRTSVCDIDTPTTTIHVDG